ncbi:MAG: hypothetical protein KME30_12170 [Iphinoe sp. HA4291-MV1]|nr:hypothetical protein [Iphinoe sp. HA4291-MV1]
MGNGQWAMGNGQWYCSFLYQQGFDHTQHAVQYFHKEWECQCVAIVLRLG